MADRLVVVPSVSEPELPGDFTERAEEEGAELAEAKASLEAQVTVSAPAAASSSSLVKTGVR